MLTERGVKILKILINSKKHISISELADYFDLSERSIRYDIEKINKVLKPKSLPLIKKVAVGNLALDSKDLVQDYIDSLETLYYSSESRQKFMLYKVVLTGAINLSSMTEKLSISRTSVKKDVEAIKETLETFKLKLVHRHTKGLVITGEENDFREMQLILLNNPLKLTKINTLLIQPLITDYFKTIDSSTIDEFINAIETETNNIISDQAYDILKIYLLITIKRLKENKMLTTHPSDEHIYVFTPEFESIQNYISILEDPNSITFNNHELIKITDIFISSPSYNFPEGFYNNWYEIELFVNKLAHDFSKEYGLNLMDDKELIKDLITYLKPILYSEQKRIANKDDMNAHIIDLYPDIHKIVVNILEKNHNDVLTHLSSNDIMSITIYFIASVERNKYKIKTKKNILIVCGMGYGTSKLVELQLKQKYNLNIIDTIPYHYVKNFNKLDAVDLIITTCEENFDGIDQPVIHVQPHITKEGFNILDSYNLQKLERQIPLSKLVNILKTNYEENEKSKLLELFKNTLGDLIIDDITPADHSLLDFLSLDHVYVNMPFKGWEEAIGYAADLLNEKGYVTHDYKTSLINAFEKYSSYMLISKGVGIPHARNNNSILKTGMVLITLENPVVTPSGKNLEVILAFTSADNVEHLDALGEFSDLLLYSNFKDFAANADSPEAILNFMKAKNNQL